VREDFQGMGIASHLLIQLERIAMENGFKGFTATVLKNNNAMIKVFDRHYGDRLTVQKTGYELVLAMDFK